MTANADIEIHIPILKMSEEARIVTGVVLEPEVVDGQGDIESEEAIADAAHAWLAGYGNETELGLMHSQFGDIGVELYESYIAPIDFTIGDGVIRKGSWVMSVHVVDDALWARVKNKEINGFSIQGTAQIDGPSEEQ